MSPSKTIDTEQLANEVVDSIERVKAGISEWNNSVAQVIGHDEIAVAISLVRDGKYDQALERLWAVAMLEATYSEGSHFADVAKTLELGWRTWQQENSLGPAPTRYSQAAPHSCSAAPRQSRHRENLQSRSTDVR